MTDSSGEDAPKNQTRPSLALYSAGLGAVIFVNLYIIWYFVIGMPAECAALAIASAGRETCGPGPAVPVILLVNAVLIAASIFLLCRWHLGKK